jgi:hypothetical protein
MFLRNVLGALALIAMSVGLVMAEPVKGRITKIADGKITVMVGKKGEAKANTYELAKDVKVLQKKKDQTVEADGGIKNKALQNIDETKGVFATVNVEANKVTEIVLGGGGKKKKDNQ